MMLRMNMSVGDAGCGEGESGLMGKCSRMRCGIGCWMNVPPTCDFCDDLDLEIILCSSFSFVGILFSYINETSSSN
jgi:hypothetical protein